MLLQRQNGDTEMEWQQAVKRCIGKGLTIRNCGCKSKIYKDSGRASEAWNRREDNETD